MKQKAFLWVALFFVGSIFVNTPSGSIDLWLGHLFMVGSIVLSVRVLQMEKPPISWAVIAVLTVFPVMLIAVGKLAQGAYAVAYVLIGVIFKLCRLGR